MVSIFSESIHLFSGHGRITSGSLYRIANTVEPPSDRLESLAEASIISKDMVEPQEKGFIHLEIRVPPPEKEFTSSGKDFRALRKKVVNPEMEMTLLAEKIIKLEMKIIALENVYVGPAEDFNFLRIAIAHC